MTITDLIDSLKTIRKHHGRNLKVTNNSIYGGVQDLTTQNIQIKHMKILNKRESKPKYWEYELIENKTKETKGEKVLSL